MIQKELVGFLLLKIWKSHFFYISLPYMKNQVNQVANCLCGLFIIYGTGRLSRGF